MKQFTIHSEETGVCMLCHKTLALCQCDVDAALAAAPPSASFIEWLSEDWVTSICTEYDGAGDKQWVEESAVRRVKDMLRKAHKDFIDAHPGDAPQPTEKP